MVKIAIIAAVIVLLFRTFFKSNSNSNKIQTKNKKNNSDKDIIDADYKVVDDN